MRFLTALLFSALMLLAAAMAGAQERSRVVAVNYPLQFMAERLLGEAGEVTFPVPADMDPSFWRPSIADISEIQSSDLILLNGAGFATWVDRVSLPRSKLVNTTSAIENEFIVTEKITHSHGDGGEHSHEGVASYVWLDPTMAIAQAEAIAAAIAGRQLAPADEVYARFGTLRSELEALDALAQSSLAGLSDTVIVATHPRYQYFARRYGLEISSLEWEAGAKPTEGELEDLRVLVDNAGAQVLIWEAEPPSDALAATQALGLINIIFPPLSRLPEGTSFLAEFEAAIAALSDVAVE